MEKKTSEFSQKSLVNELVEGRFLTEQLQFFVRNSEPNTSCNINEITHGLLIVQNILAKFESSLQILTTGASSSSPNSFNGSPFCQESKGDLKNLQDHNNGSIKGRKLVPRVTTIVQGCINSGLEGPVEDGFSWRKYGQKDINGAKYPRSYYRCTLRKEGCSATKLVQRSEEDAALFEVTYRGKHTCSQTSSSVKIITPKPEPIDTLAYPICHHTKETMLIFEKCNFKSQ